MNNYVKYAASAIIASMALTGCIRDEINACPPLKVVLAVKDRSYSNSLEVGYDDPHFNDEAFKDLCPTVYYVLRESRSGEVLVEVPSTEVHHNKETHELEFDADVPYGDYILTVWGAVDDDAEIGDDISTFDLTGLSHEVFLTNDSIHYDYEGAEVFSELERVNGIVLVETRWETFPKGIDASEKKFTQLSSEVNCDFKYDNVQDMLVYYSFDTASEVMSETVLPPSIKDNSTKMTIRYYNSSHPELPGIRPATIGLTVHRNKVTRIQISFDPYSESLDVEMMVNGHWQNVNEMKVD